VTYLGGVNFWPSLCIVYSITGRQPLVNQPLVNCLQQNNRNMSHSLSSWLNSIKSDDIDGGLAADFDGSFSGLGSELSCSNPYNMRYLLSDN